MVCSTLCCPATCGSCSPLLLFSTSRSLFQASFITSMTVAFACATCFVVFRTLGKQTSGILLAGRGVSRYDFDRPSGDMTRPIQCRGPSMELGNRTLATTQPLMAWSLDALLGGHVARALQMDERTNRRSARVGDAERARRALTGRERAEGERGREREESQLQAPPNRKPPELAVRWFRCSRQTRFYFRCPRQTA